MPALRVQIPQVARNEGATRLVVIPMFPQYSESTTASGIDTLAKELGTRVKIPTFEVILRGL